MMIMKMREVTAGEIRPKEVLSAAAGVAGEVKIWTEILPIICISAKSAQKKR